MISNLSIRNKLLLIALLPLSALMYFVIESSVEDKTTRDNLLAVYDDVLEIQKLSDVLHQIQQERGFSITYVATEGERESAQLFSQRLETDKAIAALKELRKSFGKSNAYSPLDHLQQIRAGITSLEYTTDSIASYMLRTDRALMEEITLLSNRSTEADISQLLKTHLFLIHAKAPLGEIRTLVYRTLLAGGFADNNFARFAALKGRFDFNMYRFRSNAPPVLLTELDRLLAQPSPQTSLQLIDSVYRNEITALAIPTRLWRENVTTLLQSLKTLEDLSSENILQLARAKVDQTTNLLIRNLVIALLVIALITAILFHVIRNITSSVHKIRQAADSITRGDVNLRLAIDTKDEIGALASSFNQLIEVTKEYSNAAELIGKGDYSTSVKVRSDADTLGIALNNMRSDLQTLAKENEERTWLLTGNSELNNSMRGEKDAGEVAQQIITCISNYLEAQVGAIYLIENGHLQLAGSFAYQPANDSNKLIPLGQGLAGQAAVEKKPIIFKEVPNDYLKINSALGSTSPNNILVCPFMFENDVKGVIELGAIRAFTNLDLQLFDLVKENIGIAINSAQSRMQLKELLEETQRQTEELEAQQEELRQINEELQEKAKLLEDSEAELKAQQEELQQTNEELEEKANLLELQKDKLAESKAEIETKARELEITSRYKSEFLANMSHELRTPLNSILILAQILSENKSNVLGEKEVNFARNIYNSGTDLLSLINEILDLSKIESGKVELEIREVHVSELMTDIRAMFEEVANKKNIGFRIEHKVENLTHPFLTDELRLEQILRNLLSNAFKFTEPDGHVTLKVQAQTDNLPAGFPTTTGQLLVFSVEDTGVGIPENKLETIFEAFQQADGSTKRKYGGTGLGLSISRELAHALGGEISVNSTEGKGSTFTLYLPLQFEAPRAVTPNRNVHVRQKVEDNGKPEPELQPVEEVDVIDDRFIIKENDKVILIVEDDPRLAEVLLKFVQKKGYKGILAYQGNTGLSLARHYRPDAIILDTKLPVMSGTEVLKHLKNDPALRHIPVQVISGDDYRKQGVELGAFDFLRKPFDKIALDSAFGRIEEFVHRPMKRLLVVEDDQSQNEAIKELVGNGDVKSYSAYTGIEAYQLMEKEKFDCVIIDLGLPDMTGLDLMEKIKGNQRLNKTPVIVYTGKDLSKAEATQLNKLANTVVLKTVDSHERLLDETILFLHRVESKLPAEKQQIIRTLHRTEEVLRGKKIMVVDDDMRNIYSLTNALEEEGVTCVTADNGIAAIACLKEHPDTDIVLMDIMMPEMDGYEATRAIRKQEKHEKLPIIALTAKAMKGDREKCLEAGMSDYITKPVNIEQLLSLMRVWLYK